MSANKAFRCPSCGDLVEAKADYIARGLKCPGCGTGFIPVERKTRETQRRMPTRDKAVLCAIAGVLALGALASLVSLWAAAVVCALGLLAGILFMLFRIAGKTDRR